MTQASNPKIQLIVGLGNPGDEYHNTRHNVGMLFVEQLAQTQSAPLTMHKKFHGYTCQTNLFTHKIYLLIPTTFMNLSGQAVQAITQFYKIPTNSILVVHDDLDLPMGTVRLKIDGGHGGHNGLRDIIQHLGSTNFLRLRIGISHPGEKNKVVNYVLGQMNNSEQQLIDNAFADAMQVLPDILDGNVKQAMQVLHTP